jgi:hypothetical protein
MLVLVIKRDIEMAQPNEHNNPIVRALKRIARGRLEITADNEEVKIGCKAYSITWKTPRDIIKFLNEYYAGTDMEAKAPFEFKLEVPNPFSIFADETNRYAMRKSKGI